MLSFAEANVRICCFLWTVNNCLRVVNGRVTVSIISPRQSSSQMILRSRGHSFHVSRVTYETTKRSFLMCCRYREKSVLLGLGCTADV